ncbi:MAG: hypothetical protein V6Z82_05295 [Flavobacteriales bacterium]
MRCFVLPGAILGEPNALLPQSGCGQRYGYLIDLHPELSEENGVIRAAKLL